MICLPSLWLRRHRRTGSRTGQWQILDQDLFCRLPHARFRKLAALFRFEQRGDILRAAHLIYAGIHRFGEPIYATHLRNTPRHRDLIGRRRRPRGRSITASPGAVGRDPPIAKHNALEAIGAAQKICKQRLAETRAHFLQRLAFDSDVFQNGIRRHHGSDVSLERTEKWLDVIRKLLVGDRGKPAVVVMAVPAVLLRAVPYPVLDDRYNGVRTQAVSPILHAFDIRFHLRSRHVGIFSKTFR